MSYLKKIQLAIAKEDFGSRHSREIITEYTYDIQKYLDPYYSARLSRKKDEQVSSSLDSCKHILHKMISLLASQEFGTQQSQEDLVRMTEAFGKSLARLSAYVSLQRTPRYHQLNSWRKKLLVYVLLSFGNVHLLHD